MTKHVCFGNYAMQRSILPPLLYCSVLSRRYEKEEHQIGLKFRRMLERMHVQNMEMRLPCQLFLQHGFSKGYEFSRSLDTAYEARSYYRSQSTPPIKLVIAT